MTQAERVLRHMEECGSITPMEAMEEYGIMRLASRISDLKRLGYPIQSQLVRGKNRLGEETQYSRYRLKEVEL